MPKVLTKLRFTEVSSVDRGAGVGTKVMLMKRDDRSRFQQIFEKAFDEAAQVNDDTTATTPTTNAASDRISALADLVVEGAGGKIDRAAALAWILHTPQGQSMLLRIGKNSTEKDKQPMELVQAVIKQYGIHAVSKSMIAENRSFGIPEAEFTSLIDAEAQQTRKAGETREQCFARFFTDPANSHLQKAHAIAKNAALMDLSATQVGAEDALDTNPDSSAAMLQLQNMAERLRRESPWLSVAQGFSRVFTDPANAAIAARAHKRPTATTAFAFPR